MTIPFHQNEPEPLSACFHQFSLCLKLKITNSKFFSLRSAGTTAEANSTAKIFKCWCCTSTFKYDYTLVVPALMNNSQVCFIQKPCIIIQNLTNHKAWWKVVSGCKNVCESMLNQALEKFMKPYLQKLAHIEYSSARFAKVYAVYTHTNLQNHILQNSFVKHLKRCIHYWLCCPDPG